MLFRVLSKVSAASLEAGAARVLFRAGFTVSFRVLVRVLAVVHGVTVLSKVLCWLLLHFF